MRVVVDTNVLMSGIFFGGVPGRIVEAWATGRLDLVRSPEILDDYRRVGSDLATRYPERAVALLPMLTLLATHGTMVNAVALGVQVSEDKADDMFLAAAVTGDTRTIISGDKHLLDVSGWRGTTVLTPRRFVDQYLLAP